MCHTVKEPLCVIRQSVLRTPAGQATRMRNRFDANTQAGSPEGWEVCEEWWSQGVAPGRDSLDGLRRGRLRV